MRHGGESLWQVFVSQGPNGRLFEILLLNPFEFCVLLSVFASKSPLRQTKVVWMKHPSRAIRLDQQSESSGLHTPTAETFAHDCSFDARQFSSLAGSVHAGSARVCTAECFFYACRMKYITWLLSNESEWTGLTAHPTSQSVWSWQTDSSGVQWFLSSERCSLRQSPSLEVSATQTQNSHWNFDFQQTVTDIDSSVELTNDSILSIVVPIFTQEFSIFLEAKSQPFVWDLRRQSRIKKPKWTRRMQVASSHTLFFLIVSRQETKPWQQRVGSDTNNSPWHTHQNIHFKMKKRKDSQIPSDCCSLYLAWSDAKLYKKVGNFSVRNSLFLRHVRVQATEKPV